MAVAIVYELPCAFWLHRVEHVLIIKAVFVTVLLRIDRIFSRNQPDLFCVHIVEPVGTLFHFLNLTQKPLLIAGYILVPVYCLGLFACDCSFCHN